MERNENCDRDEDEKSTKAEAEQECDRANIVAALMAGGHWARVYLRRTWALMD